MLPPHSTSPTFIPLKRSGQASRAASPPCAGALGDRLFQRGVVGHGGLEVGLLTDQDVLDQRVGDGEGDVAHRLDGDALGDGLTAAFRSLATAPGAERGIHGRLDAEDADVGLHRFRRDRTARDQTAAADRNDETVQIRRVLEEFHGADTLTRDDPRVVEGRDKDKAFLVAQPVRLLGRAGEVQALDHHGRAMGPGAVRLHEGRAFRHDDGHGNAQPGAVIGQGLGVVAGRGRHHAAPALVGRQLQQPVQRAAFLETAGEVKVVELDPDLGPGQLRQPP